jgi:hypothetical protein
MVRRDGEQEVKTSLACETLVEDGMQVAFLDYFSEPERHVYRIEASAIAGTRCARSPKHSPKPPIAVTAAAAIAPARRDSLSSVA